VGALQSMMYRLKERSGVSQLRWHILRHTFSNWWLAAGGGLRQLQSILGHADITMTASTYTDPDLDLLKRCHARASPFSTLDLNRTEEAG
jgi:site-specific recombinase XerD